MSLHNSANESKNINYCWVFTYFAAVMTVSLIIAYLLSPGWKYYIATHIVLENLGILIAFAIFVFIWYVSKIGEVTLLLGYGFLSAAILHAIHVIFWHNHIFFLQ